MQLNLLHVDDALTQQPRFMDACLRLQASEVDARDLAAHVRLWGKNDALSRLQNHITTSLHSTPSEETLVTFMGSGDFHHVSALLIGMLAETRTSPFTIIHFDNHPDWVHFKGGMHCGSWVNRALDTAHVKKVITIGVCSNDLVRPQFKGANLDALRDGKIALLPWESPSERFRGGDISQIDVDVFLEILESLIPTRDVYITIDKDVLSHDNAITNWDQGKMGLDRLLRILQSILSRHHAIGIDVNGDYSVPRYDGKRHQIWLKKIEALIDQPKPVMMMVKAADINQSSNLALLDAIREVL